uniref:IkB n=1 Tax=Tigriopus japonicus TaxID=158387 RepID=X2CHQ0_TIGJA|nr:IkB [Tigriopus japonicus]
MSNGKKVASDQDQALTDSGAQDTMLFQSSSNSTECGTDESPVIQMPNATGTVSSERDMYRQALYDSGLCSELGQLSLSSSDSLTAAKLQEYYEPDEDGDVQLHLAIASGFTDVAMALIKMAPHPDYLSIPNKALYSPLHIAVLQDQPQVVRRLVIAGARIDFRDSEGNTPLHLAARRGNLACAEAILKPVAVQEVEEAGLPQSLFTALPADVIEQSNNVGEQCVHLATMGGHSDFLRFLCWHNADMNAPDGRGGRAPLHFAVGARQLYIIECLIDQRPQGCGVNANQLDWYGRTPYQLAVLNGSIEIANYISQRVTGCTLPEVDTDAEDSEIEYNQMRRNDSNLLLNSSA